MNKFKNMISAGYIRIRQSFTGDPVSWLAVPAVLYTIYLLAGILNHTFTDVNIPNEYREAANVLLTDEFLKGINPYSAEVLKQDMPAMIYLYGPLYSLVTAFFGLFIHIDLVLLHYLVTFACIIGSAILGAKMTARYAKTPVGPILTFLFLINCHWRYSYVNAVPDSMGLFMMVLILYLLSKEKMRFRPVMIAVLTVLIFFTKQYFLLIAGTATAYFFLFISKKDCFKYLGSMAVTAGALAGLIQWKCPMFWTFVIYLAKGPGKGISGTVTRGTVKMSGEAYNFSQIMSIGGMFLMLFVAASFFILLTIFKKKLEKIDFLLFGHMVVAGICLLYIGQNDGAWLSYYLELFVPALVIEALILMERWKPSAGKNAKYVIFSVFYVMLMCFTIYRTDARLPKSQMTAENYQAWDEAISIMDSNKGDMYLYPLLAYYGVKNDIYVYNTGQPFVITQKFYDRYLKSESSQEQFPYAGGLFKQHLDYREEIKNKVQNGEYSVVSYIKDYDEVFDEADLNMKYKKEKTLTLRAGRWTWDVEFWTLK
ncbi:MAG: DUF2029 domain-containing protein [Lachnospiraceae bacterium]|nr:DUF2029 domain-containing protein [Lachnospiraceae bacterium]